MRQALLLVTLLSAFSASAQVADEPELQRPAPLQPNVPFYVPRSLMIGGIFSEAGGPLFRLTWEPELYGDNTGHLLLVVDGGLSYALLHPTNAGPRGTATMTFFYQHLVVFGLGYRSA